jgi:hypothetical protein
LQMLTQQADCQQQNLKSRLSPLIRPARALAYERLRSFSDRPGQRTIHIMIEEVVK